jgi:hypothetical protein
VQRDAFLFLTLLHETGHALSSGFVESNTQQTVETIKSALGERYSTIEECRADLLGSFLLSFLAQHGVLPQHIRSAAPTTFVAHTIRAVRFGVKSDHARAAAIILSHLFRAKAIRKDGRSLSVDAARTESAVRNLAAEVQSITYRGDYDGAGRLIQELGTVPREIAELLVRTKDVPIDLEFVFDNFN